MATRPGRPRIPLPRTPLLQSAADKLQGVSGAFREKRRFPFVPLARRSLGARDVTIVDEREHIVNRIDVPLRFQ